MRTDTVDVSTPDGAADAYLARPDDEPAAGVLFIMDAYGLRPAIEEMVQRVAQRGFAVMAPNMFYRAGRAPVLPLPDHSNSESRAEFFERVRPLAAQLTPEALIGDGAAYLDYLSGFAPGRAGITGYCMGVRFGWRIAVGCAERVAALGGFHGGGLATDAPDSPHRSADRLRAELYLGHADQDGSMTPERIAMLERALDEAGVRYRSEVYAGAMHGYAMPDTPAHNQAAAERHFRELFALLARAVAAPSRGG